MKNKASNTSVRKLALSAMFIALGMILPFVTGQIQQIGNMLLPMHLPVFLCGLICGWQYGGVVGIITPLLRSVSFGMPYLYPTAVGMAVELAVYGIVAGLIYNSLRRQNIIGIYAAMIPAMLIGRVFWGMAQTVLLGLSGNTFTWQMFAAGAFVSAIPGIILQLVFIPAVMSVLHITGVLKFRRETA